MQFWSEAIEKQVGDRVQMVLGDPYLLAAFREYGADILRRSSVFHGLDKFLKQREVRGKLCFEIGTWNGMTAAILSRYFEKVITVDIERQAIKRDVLRHLGIANVECIDIADNAHKAKVWRKIALECDFAFIDGDHAADTESDFNLVKGCGRVLFHEVWPWQEPVWHLVHTLRRDSVTFNGCGLALWEHWR